MVRAGSDEGIGLEFFQRWQICLMQSAAKHMAKKMAMHARYVATVLLNLIMIINTHIREREIGQKLKGKQNCDLHERKCRKMFCKSKN